MAGHSQFKNIMHRKGRQDKARSKLFGKLAREITTAAKLGQPDPAFNPRLRAAIIAARAENMTKDVIERAIRKSQGGDAENYDEMRYEGYGPGGVAVIVEVLTDNRTAPRATSSDLHQGRRQPRRDRRGVVHVRPRRRGRVRRQGRDRRPDAGSRDRRRRRNLLSDEDGHEVYTTTESLRDVAKALEARFGEPRKAALVWKPKNTVAVDDEKGEQLIGLLETLNENDDVQNVYANFEVSDAVVRQDERPS